MKSPHIPSARLLLLAYWPHGNGAATVSTVQLFVDGRRALRPGYPRRVRLAEMNRGINSPEVLPARTEKTHDHIHDRRTRIRVRPLPIELKDPKRGQERHPAGSACFGYAGTGRPSWRGTFADARRTRLTFSRLHSRKSAAMVMSATRAATTTSTIPFAESYRARNQPVEQPEFRMLGRRAGASKQS